MGMLTLHGAQRAISVIAAGAGAAIPFVPAHWAMYLVGAVAVLLAVNHELGKATEIRGDADASVGESPAQSNAVAKAAAKVAPLACLALILTGCSAAGKAAAATDVRTAIDITNAVCAVAPEVPVDGPLVTLVCQLVAVGEGVALVAIDGLPVPATDGGTTVAATQQVAVTRIYVQVPKAQAAEFLARHAARHP